MVRSDRRDAPCFDELLENEQIRWTDLREDRHDSPAHESRLHQRPHHFDEWSDQIGATLPASMSSLRTSRSAGPIFARTGTILRLTNRGSTNALTTSTNGPI